MQNLDLISVIIAGVTTGGLSCFAVQGGLLTSAIANARKNREQLGLPPGNDFLQVITFILTKLIAYTGIGAILGVFGSFFSISSQFQAILQIGIGIYMLGLAGSLLNIHPFFRYFVIQPPFFIQKLVRKVAKGNDELTTPALLGLMTVFIPCGTTLAMEALAISSGSALRGALILATFVIASSWMFIAVGLASTKLSGVMQSYFYKISGAVLIVLAIMSANSGLNLLGSPVSLDTITATKQKPSVASAQIQFDMQRVKMMVDSRGYTTDTKLLKKDVPVELTLESRNSYSCANAFAIPSLNIVKILPENGTEKVTFTPTKTGKLAYSCSMGMFRGEFIVK